MLIQTEFTISASTLQAAADRQEGSRTAFPNRRLSHPQHRSCHLNHVASPQLRARGNLSHPQQYFVAKSTALHRKLVPRSAGYPSPIKRQIPRLPWDEPIHAPEISSPQKESPRASKPASRKEAFFSYSCMKLLHF
ncbi:hypothetical protein CCHR01_12623 [Colletotrichum chrysophilum]|uniref:Uncharacterized protein n=1 Tax=Colletotrichum chrysophilum TaxID=1836956 RepID=A0AAD9ADR9_9PEZI|nr:hypothetical protein CCHR01_12623 [Colletotrichum chrysophilum]